MSNEDRSASIHAGLTTTGKVSIGIHQEMMSLGPHTARTFASLLLLLADEAEYEEPSKPETRKETP